MILDPANSNKSEAQLYVEALGGKKHGRIPGFGNHVDDSIIPATNKRARANKYTSSSQSTEVQSNQRYFSEAEVQQVLDGKDEQFAQTMAEREQTWNERFARSDNLIEFLYAKLGMPLTHNMVPSMMMPGVTSLQTGLPVSIETGQHSLLMPGVTTDEIVSQPSVAAIPSVNGFTGLPNANRFSGLHNVSGFVAFANVNGIPGHVQQQNVSPTA